jgi:predicted ATPase
VAHGAGGERLYASADGKPELYGDEPTATPRTVVPFDRRRSFLSALEAGDGNRRVVAFREAVRSIVAVKPAHDLGGAAVSEAKTLDRELRNFASWYRGRVGEDPEAVEALRLDLEGVLKTFTALWLEPGADDSVSPLARFTANGRSYDVSWSQLSDGERRIIALYGLLRLGLRRASVMVLDDIAPFVSAAALLPWLRALVDTAAEHGQQLVVVTHQPEAIDYMAADAVYRMWREDVDGKTCIEQLVPELLAGELTSDLVRFGHVEGAGVGVP